MASSSDGGRSFGPNARLTDRLTNLSTGILGPVGTTSFFAPAMTPLGNDEVLVAWADSRPANFEFDNQDSYSSKVRVNPTGPPPSQQVPLGQSAAVSAASPGSPIRGDPRGSPRERP